MKFLLEQKEMLGDEEEEEEEDVGRSVLLSKTAPKRDEYEESSDADLVRQYVKGKIYG